MKYLFLPLFAAGLLWCARAAESAALRDESPGDGLGRRVAEVIASADSAGIRRDMSKKEEEVLIRDAAWIRRIGECVGEAPVSKPVQCMCIGWTTAYFYKEGELVASVAAIHGHQIRIHSKVARGDFPIDEKSWKAVEAALQAPVDGGEKKNAAGKR